MSPQPTVFPSSVEAQFDGVARKVSDGAKVALLSDGTPQGTVVLVEADGRMHPVAGVIRAAVECTPEGPPQVTLTLIPGNVAVIGKARIEQAAGKADGMEALDQ